MEKNLYGLLAEFDTATEMVDAANAIREAGYTKTDAFSPFPLHEIDEALGIKRSILPVMVFFGGITGLCLGLGLQVFVHYIDYPLNAGGRPFLSWPNFIPPAVVSNGKWIGGTTHAARVASGAFKLSGFAKPYAEVSLSRGLGTRAAVAVADEYGRWE